MSVLVLCVARLIVSWYNSTRKESFMKIRLYHTGHEVIQCPDIHHGRVNADFGQGFYLSDAEAFVGKWVHERRGQDVIVNTYELELDGLNVLRFERDETWLQYITSNRGFQKDAYPEVDVIIGPISNDTIYDTLGILASGFFDKEESLRLMKVGPTYYQTVLKSEKAVSNLMWIGSRVLEQQEINQFKDINKREEKEYLEELTKAMNI